MASLKKYDLLGEKKGVVAVKKAFVKEKKASSQMLKDYIVALRENARQWSANTKTRSEVKHTTKKPHRQKGTGRARQGSLVTPQFRGGGIVFGPKPKFFQNAKCNKKEKKAAIRHLIAEKMGAGRLVIVEDFFMDQPKTKTVVGFLKKCGLNKRVLFLGTSESKELEVEGEMKKIDVHSEKHRNFAKSVRNIPKVQFTLAQNVNGYELLLANDLVMTEAALNELTEWLY